MIQSLSLNEILTATLVLFAVIDVIGSIPVILDIKSKAGHIDPRQATIVSALIMFSFLFVGNQILLMIGIDVASFSIAGSIVIFMIGMEMVLNRNIFNSKGQAKASTIVPIAFPLIAGAGTLTTLLSLRAEYQMINLIIALLINIGFIYIVLLYIPKIEKFLGEGSIVILRTVFGIILLSIAIKLFSSNVGLLFK